VYTYNSSNLEETQRTAKTTKAIGLIPTIPPRLKFTRKPAILTIKMKTKTKMIQPYQRARIIEAETTSCQRPLRTTKGDT